MKMKSIFLRLTLFLIATLTSCGFDCIDKKTGMHRSSQRIEQSKEKEVYQFNMSTNRKSLKVDNERKLVIKNAWIENTWMYECIDNHAVLKKQTQFQMVIDAEYERPESDSLWYTLWSDNSNFGFVLGGQLTFNYFGQDTLSLTLYNDEKKPIDKLKFWKTN